MNTTAPSRIALVTGAGSGIGQACTLAPFEDGWTVEFAGRRIEACTVPLRGRRRPMAA